MNRVCVILTLALLLGAVFGHRAAAQTAEAATAAEIRQPVAALQERFNRGDAKGLAALWVPDGEFIGPTGRRIVGREQIEAAFGDYFAANKDLKLQLGIASWRLVNENVALVDMMTELTPPPEALPSEPVSTMVLVQRNGRWYISSMYEMLTAVPSHRLHLKRLQWLLGDWMEQRDDPPGLVLRTTCDWNSSGQYLIRKFLTGGQGAPALSGTEVIGWDPRSHRIRSWTFEPDGGFGESTWTRDGERWVIEHRGTLANGSDLLVTYLVTPMDADTMKVEATHRLVNGERQPPLPEIVLKRRIAKTGEDMPPVKLPERVLP